MKLEVVKQINFIKKFQKYELIRMLGRAIYSDLRLSIIFRFYFYFRFLLRDFYMAKKDLFCFFTFRKMGVVRPFNMNRMIFRKYCFSGLLSGIKKSVW